MTDTSADVEIAGTVAIVGFPNVGKSTLINRLTATRTAVVHETPGVTRDRKELLCEWSGTTFRLIDTGGVDRADAGPFGPQIRAQAREAIEEADLVLFVVDAKVGVTPMIGVNDVTCENFRTSDASVLVNFAQANSFINLLAYWEQNADPNRSYINIFKTFH